MAKLVWIVDDDQGILEVTEIVLHEAGFDVQKISSAKQFNDMLKSVLPDLILLDIRIADLNGTDAAKQLKSDIRTKHIPIIMMSADTDLTQKFKEVGADGYIKKPYDIADLEEMVKKYIKTSTIK